ncbi:NUDIX hydrolase [Streptomyces violascens]|uniref:NUDIX hydrolase n=1 Tax=Streptomyces violascens TaxID=67381 RepID=UPI0016747C94|nr:NUDIX domain-containing protein [Streptomyces violascens]GGU38107.1 NUDIX hydrolase [Streptomyces violascens]
MGELIERVDAQDHVIGVVERGDAVRNGWLYRMSMVLCRDPDGRYLVHQRPKNSSRFPGQYSWLVAGAVGVGESYEAAAGRELAEEMGVTAAVTPLFKFLCDGELGPYWFAVHEATIDPVQLQPSREEIGWCDWLAERELTVLVDQWPFVSDSRDAFERYLKYRSAVA